MTSVSDSEIKEIVQRVVQNALGGRNLPYLSLGTTFKDQDPKIRAESKGPVSNLVALGSDHGGFELKEVLKMSLSEAGYQIFDCGTYDKSSVDYPDFALAVAEKVSSGEAWRGIVIDGAGIGSCMAANKVPGVRAAMCYDYATAVNSREHNDANVLTLGAGLIGVNQAKLIADTWLKEEFAGGRHANRVNKIINIEKKYFKGGS